MIKCTWSRLNLHCRNMAIKNVSGLTLHWVAIFMLDQILSLSFCQNEHHLSSISQVKASITMKNNISLELHAVVIQNKCNCLLAAEMGHSLYCWVIPRLLRLVAVFFRGRPLPCSQQGPAGTVLAGRVAAGPGEQPWGSSHCGSWLSAEASFPNAASTSIWLVCEVRCTFSLKCYAWSLSAAACFGNICLKVDLRP